MILSGTLIKNYKICDVIGYGGFGKVYSATHLPTEITVAIKVIPKSLLEDKKARANYEHEKLLLSKCNHPYIVKFFEAFSDENYEYLVQEYICGGTILEYINRHPTVNEAIIKKFFVQIVIAVQYMHESLSIAHRDIKAENILLDENRNIRFVDFGLSTCFDQSLITKTQCGTAVYAAPEMIANNGYGTSIDIWSLGILLYTFFHRKFPFYDANETVLFKKIVNDSPEINKTLSPQLQDLIKQFLKKDPKERISLEEALQHPWLSSLPMLRSTKYCFSFISQEILAKRLSHAGYNIADILYDKEVKIAHDIIERNMLKDYISTMSIAKCNSNISNLKSNQIFQRYFMPNPSSKTIRTWHKTKRKNSFISHAQLSSLF